MGGGAGYLMAFLEQCNLRTRTIVQVLSWSHLSASFTLHLDAIEENSSQESEKEFDAFTDADA
jgi:hypothetical protein